MLAGSITLLASGFDGTRGRESPLVFFPGTQVGTVEPVEAVSVCKQCHHSESQDHPVSVFRDWSGSMMAQSARDPVFYAALAVANKDRTTSGEYCIRCHSPSGWLAGHSEDFTGRSLSGTDFDGVQCDYCHRAGDPLRPDTSIPMVGLPPGYGNGMHAVQRSAYPKRGPYGSLIGPHATVADSFQRSSDLCGVCHDVSNPFYAQDRTHQPPYEYGAIERTYSEWAESWYALQGDSGTCQSCHMRASAGYSCTYPSSFHANLAAHDFTGGNTFVPGILQDFWPDADTAALSISTLRAQSTLERAASLTVTASRDSVGVAATVRVTNLTGHKLPTGYPEGRRMWIELIGQDSAGNTLFWSGRYTDGNLIRDADIKVYEVIRGLTDTTAAASGLPPGASFHFILNDSVLSDNRIPPRGYLRKTFLLRHAQPVGANYADGQFWDDTPYKLPASVTDISATLRYQTIGKEYIDFLRTENSANTYDWNQWGEKLSTAWQVRGMSSPVAMASGRAHLEPLAAGPDRGEIPRRTEIFQNYPNPFNSDTRIVFRVSETGQLRLAVFDLQGARVLTLFEGRKGPGEYTISFHPAKLPAGVYFYRLESGTTRQTRKMAYIR